MATDADEQMPWAERGRDGASEDALRDVPAERIAEETAASMIAGGLSSDRRFIRAALEIAIIGDVCPATMRATASAFGYPTDFLRTVVNGEIARHKLALAEASKAVAPAQSEAERASVEQASQLVVALAVAAEARKGSAREIPPNPVTGAD